IGRTFSRREFDQAESVVVLSEGLWRSSFAGSDGVVGRTLSIAGAGYRVIGVMPRTFQLPTSDTRFWIPLSAFASWSSARTARDGDGFEVIGRLQPGVGLEQASAEMRGIAARL